MTFVLTRNTKSKRDIQLIPFLSVCVFFGYWSHHRCCYLSFLPTNEYPWCITKIQPLLTSQWTKRIYYFSELLFPFLVLLLFSFSRVTLKILQIINREKWIMFTIVLFVNEPVQLFWQKNLLKWTTVCLRFWDKQKMSFINAQMYLCLIGLKTMSFYNPRL